MLARAVIVALLWILTTGPLASPAARLPATVAIQHVTVDELRAHVSLLASDRLAGRGVGHPGNRDAENYIAASLKNANVAPALPGYLQPLEVYQPLLGGGARLTVRAGNEALAELGIGADFFPLPESSDLPAAGPIVFAGFGLSAPELEHDDYARLSAADAIVMVLDGAPEGLRGMASLSSEARAEIGGIERKVRDARAHGAAGLLVVRRYPGTADYFWPEHPSVRSSNYRLYGDMRAHPLAVATISERAAGPIRGAVEQGKTVTATLTPDVIVTPITIDNILGVRPD